MSKTSPTPAKTVSDSLTHSTGSFELVVAGVLLGLIGYAIDNYVGTTPLFLIVFTVLGFVGAAISLYYRYKFQIESRSVEAGGGQ